MGKTRRAKGPCRFACDCGQVSGQLSAQAVQAGTRLECYCQDCRAAQIALGQPDPAPGAVQIFHTLPDGLEFDSGQDQLAVIRLSPKGLMRWYAACCNTPLFATLPNPKIPFLGLSANCLEHPEDLGKVQARGFVPQPGGGTRMQGALTMVWGIATRGLSARMSGAWRNTPFYDPDTGAPVVEPQVLDRAARRALTDRS